MNVLPTESLRNLAYLFFITQGMPNARKMFDTWQSHASTRDYERPALGQLEAWYTEFMEEEEL